MAHYGPTIPKKYTPKDMRLKPELRSAMSPDDAKQVEEYGMIWEAYKLHDRRRAAVETRHTMILVDEFRDVKQDEYNAQAEFSRFIDQTAMLDMKWAAGKIHMPKWQFIKLRKERLKEQESLRSRLTNYYVTSAMMAGEQAAKRISKNIQGLQEIERYKLLIASRNRPSMWYNPGRCANPGRHDRSLEKSLYRQYGGGPTKETNLSYCPIAGKRTQMISAMHLVVVCVKAEAALFGEDRAKLETNGIIMDTGYKGLLDNYKAVIVPATNKPDETELMVLTLTNDLGPADTEIWGYKSLHCRRLIFLNSNRPGKEFIYFRAITAFLLRRRYGQKNELWKKPNHYMLKLTRGLAAMPGPRMRNTVLFLFSKEVACLSDGETADLWGWSWLEAINGFSGEQIFTARALALELSENLVATFKPWMEDIEPN